MSDEMVIERIRRAMAEEVEGIRPRAETLERVLSAPPRRTLRLGWLMPALAVGVAALVAVVAVTSLTHRSPPPAPPGANVPVAARRLVSRLAVLRRAQGRRDVLGRSVVREIESLTDNASVISGLSRRVGSLQFGRFGRAGVYLMVQSPPRSPVRGKRTGPPLLNPRLGDQASIAFVGPFRIESGINHPSVAAGGDQVAAIAHGLTADPSQTTGLWGATASIVPDGVTRVKWVFTPNGTDSGLSPITVWPKVRDNVAIGQVSPKRQVYLSSAVWYGRDGRRLQSFGAMTNLPASQRKFQQALQASLHDPVDAALLQHFRVLRTSGRSRPPGFDQAAEASLLEPNPVDLNVAKARFVVYRPTGAKLFVIPGTQGLTIRSISPKAPDGTEGASLVLSGGMFGSGRASSGTSWITGLAPDGNRTIRVLLPGGGVRTAAVIDNVYSIVVPSDARTLVIRSAAGRVTRFRLHL